MSNRTPKEKGNKKTAPVMTMWQYLETSNHPIVKEAMGRYKRGDIDCIEALERIAILLLRENQTLLDEMQKTHGE